MARIFLLLALLLLAVAARAAPFDHSSWDTLLRAHVRVMQGGRVSQVDYAGLTTKKNQLADYLQQMATVRLEDFDGWTKDDQLAFLLNAYNAWTVQLILGKYPNLESIKDLGSLFQSPWKKKFIPLLGETRSLDDIEHGLIRGSGRYQDPRIHFAANCASIGCPALRAEAFLGAELDQQLEESTSHFLGDRSRNRLNGSVLELSSIFKWYGDDFANGWKSFTTLSSFLAGYAESLGLSQEDVRALTAGEIKIEFLDYDWRLNDVR